MYIYIYIYIFIIDQRLGDVQIWRLSAAFTLPGLVSEATVNTPSVIFIPIPLPKRVLQTFDCTRFFCGGVLQTVLGMGMGIDVTAQLV